MVLIKIRQIFTIYILYCNSFLYQLSVNVNMCLILYFTISYKRIRISILMKIKLNVKVCKFSEHLVDIWLKISFLFFRKQNHRRMMLTSISDGKQMKE